MALVCLGMKVVGLATIHSHEGIEAADAAVVAGDCQGLVETWGFGDHY